LTQTPTPTFNQCLEEWNDSFVWDDLLFFCEPIPTPTPTKTSTPNPTPTQTPTSTETLTPTPTITQSPTLTETSTPIATQTSTPTTTLQIFPTSTPSNTPAPTTETPTPTQVALNQYTVQQAGNDAANGVYEKKGTNNYVVGESIFDINSKTELFDWFENTKGNKFILTTKFFDRDNVRWELFMTSVKYFTESRRIENLPKNPSDPSLVWASKNSTESSPIITKTV
jgi:hypothetical protein